MLIVFGKFLLATLEFMKEHLRPSQVKVTLFRLSRKWIPMVRDEINKEIKKMEKDCTEQYLSIRDETAIVTLPEEGISREKVLDKIKV